MEGGRPRDRSTSTPTTPLLPNPSGEPSQAADGGAGLPPTVRRQLFPRSCLLAALRLADGPAVAGVAEAVTAAVVATIDRVRGLVDGVAGAVRWAAAAVAEAGAAVGDFFGLGWQEWRRPVVPFYPAMLLAGPGGQWRVAAEPAGPWAAMLVWDAAEAIAAITADTHPVWGPVGADAQGQLADSLAKWGMTFLVNVLTWADRPILAAGAPTPLQEMEGETDSDDDFMVQLLMETEEGGMEMLPAADAWPAVLDDFQEAGPPMPPQELASDTDRDGTGSEESDVLQEASSWPAPLNSFEEATNPAPFQDLFNDAYGGQPDSEVTSTDSDDGPMVQLTLGLEQQHVEMLPAAAAGPPPPNPWEKAASPTPPQELASYTDGNESGDEGTTSNSDAGAIPPSTIDSDGSTITASEGGTSTHSEAWTTTDAGWTTTESDDDDDTTGGEDGHSDSSDLGCPMHGKNGCVWSWEV